MMESGMTMTDPNPPSPPPALGDLYGQRGTTPAGVVSRAADESRRDGARKRKHMIRSFGPRRKIPALRLWLIAATFLVLLYAGWTFRTWLRLHRKAAPAPAPAPPPAAAEPAPTAAEEFFSNPLAEQVATSRRTAELIRDVRTQAMRGMTGAGIEQLEAQRRLDPDNLALKQFLAELYVQVGRYPEAEALLLQVVRASPDQVEPRMLLGRILYHREKFEAAAELAGWILQGDQGNRPARLLLAQTGLRLGQNEAAVRQLQALYEQRSDDLEVRNLLALVYLRLGQYGKAVYHLNELIRQDSPDPVSYYNLAVCYAQQKLANETVEVLNQTATRLGPAQVAEWLDSDDFQPISEQPVYATLRRQMLFAIAGQAAKEQAVGTHRQLKVDRGVGLLPEIKSDILLRR